MEVIKLNLIPGKACPVVHASQFDDGREFKAELYEGVNVYTLDGTETLTAIVKKPDGNEVTAAVTNTSDNYVIITTTEQMTACAGGNLGTLRIEKGAVTIATLNFILECQASPDTGIQSDSEIHNLEAQVNQMVEDAVAEQYDSNNVLFDTAPTSGHGVPYAVTSGGLWSWLRDLPLRAYPTASGAIATFDTSLALPLQDCTIEINAVQESGTPTPSSPKLISGFTGANIKVCGGNIWDNQWENGTYNSLGNKSNWAGAIRSKNFIDIEPSKDYCTIFGTTSQFLVFWYKADNSFIGYDTITKSGDTVTSPATAYKATFSTWNDYGSTYNNDISINYPATTTAITWQDEAGTVYGGSLDVTSGVLTVTHGIITFDGSGDEIWNDGTIRYSIEIADCERTAGRLEVLCNRGVFASSGGSEGTVFVTNTFLYYYQPTSITSLADFKTWLGSNNLVVVYPLETPVTYQLTPTQISAIVGTNNVFTDTNGNTSVMYACSLKDYIDSQ